LHEILLFCGTEILGTAPWNIRFQIESFKYDPNLHLVFNASVHYNLVMRKLSFANLGDSSLREKQASAFQRIEFQKSEDLLF
jgi:hypothetical protein